MLCCGSSGITSICAPLYINSELIINCTIIVHKRQGINIKPCYNSIPAPCV